MKIHKRKIEDLLQPHKLNHSTHDRIITNVASAIEISPNVLVMYQNAYYKIKDPRIRNGYLESDIDLMAMHYQHEDHKDILHWNEIPFNDSKILIFEMKSSNTKKSYSKAIKQLKRSKQMIKDYTNYQDIDGFYAYNVGTGHTWRYEREV